MWLSALVEKDDETRNVNEHMIKNPQKQAADKLPIYKRGRGVELGTTENNTSLWS